MWFGESEANVRELFDKARAAGTQSQFCYTITTFTTSETANV
jgi:SpoVK/Ycf46/Vps4 family AAA+-type ATPase